MKLFYCLPKIKWNYNFDSSQYISCCILGNLGMKLLYRLPNMKWNYYFDSSHQHILLQNITVLCELCTKQKKKLWLTNTQIRVKQRKKKLQNHFFVFVWLERPLNVKNHWTCQITRAQNFCAKKNRKNRN